MEQANREAKFAGISLVLTILVWLALGVGLSGFDINLFSTPIWIIAGCLGTWIFALLVSFVMSKYVIKDCNLDDDNEEVME